MSDHRITQHPILPIEKREMLSFTWQDRQLMGHQGETIAAALIANGVRIFGHHYKDGSPQGIFCANGQCAQCLILANGMPVKSCMTLIRPGMRLEPVEGLARLPDDDELPQFGNIEELEVPVLIIGGGPAGLSAAIELGKLGVETLIVDDKHRLGGKLVLQTHRFFGSVDAVYAGTRGIDIAARLETELNNYPSVRVWLNSTALAVFSDKKVGVLKEGQRYVLVSPQVLLVAAGAREKSLAFKGNTLPGVYGAGAFQTLVNRDLVRPAERLFIIGGGNVGLIAGYHALQAGITVVGLAEAMPEVGGYKVHKDKLVRMGVPIYTSHTILSANGKDGVESVTIARVDGQFRPIPGSEISFACDSVLIAVGLDPVNEFFLKAKDFGLPVYAAGDAEEIAEASAAIFSGKIRGLEIAKTLGVTTQEVPVEWHRTMDILKSKPGRIQTELTHRENLKAGPVFHCTQEIPCNPCTSACPKGLIIIAGDDIRKVPTFRGDASSCSACDRCVAFCPGLAITVVDGRRDAERPTVSIPYEFNRESINPGDLVIVLDTQGDELGCLEVADVRKIKAFDRTLIVRVKAPREIASRIAGIRVQEKLAGEPLDEVIRRIDDDEIVCRCERVTAGEIRALIRQGYRDLNEIKSITRAGMGACGSKTCTPLIHRLFREEGIPDDQVTERTLRPLFIEVPLGIFAGVKKEETP